METRREFIKKSSLFAGIAYLPFLSETKLNSKFGGVQVGLITYSFRDMPDQSAAATLSYIKEAGISAVELMGGPAESYAGAPKSTVDMRTFFGLNRRKREKADLNAEEENKLKEMTSQMDAFNKEMRAWRNMVDFSKFEAFKKMYKKAGVSIYAFKPSAFEIQNTDEDIIYGLKAAKALGANHVTLEHPSNDAQTLRLGKLAEKFGINVAYHGHLQQHVGLWDTALGQSSANKLNLDIGHYVAAGHDPLAVLAKHAPNIASMHLKDRQNKTNGAENLEWGKGNTPIADILKFISQSKTKFPVSIELEYKIPEGSSSVKEVKRCMEYCKNILT